MEGRKKMAILIDRIKVLEEMLGIMFQQGQESAYYDDKIEIGAMTYSDVEYENGKSDGMDIAYNMIADAPEIKAIPIEWIRKWNIRNYPYTALLMSEIIPKMIEDWEKEKGIDKDMPHELLSEREKRALQETVDWVRSWLGDDAVVGISYTKEDWEK